MPVAEILAGIALVKSSVDFIKSNIDTCKDIGEIGGAIDGLLRGQQEVNKKQGQRGLGVREQFDTSHIARETIDAKLAAEQLQEVANMVNLRFGPNTWKEILEERARRIAEQKEAIKQAKIEKAKADKELWADVKAVLTVLGAIIGSILGNMNSNSSGGTRTVCKTETRYTEESRTIYSHSTISFVYNGKQYSLKFKK